ncbi:hypothetical protein HKX48_004618 [Thoreauomyces humboldtii]|nr:hypothetical protein HKX48_004618 [Thoreauomyces humboldtii]
MILAILFALVLVSIVFVAFKVLEERPSQVATELLEEEQTTVAEVEVLEAVPATVAEVEVLEEVQAKALATLAAARMALIPKLLDACGESDDETALPGWIDELTLDGSLADNARLLHVMALTHHNLPGHQVRSAGPEPLSELAAELSHAHIWVTARDKARELQPALRKVSMLVPDNNDNNDAKNVRAHSVVDKRLNPGYNRQSIALMMGLGEMPSMVVHNIWCFAGTTRAFFLSAPIFNQADTTVEQEVVVVVVAEKEEEEVAAAVEQEVVVAAIVVEKVKELAAAVEQEVVVAVAVAVIVNEVKEVTATVEEEVVVAVEDFNIAAEDVVVIVAQEEEVLAKEGAVPGGKVKTKSMSQGSGKTPLDGISARNDTKRSCQVLRFIPQSSPVIFTVPLQAPSTVFRSKFLQNVAVVGLRLAIKT